MPIEDTLARIADALEANNLLLKEGLEYRKQLIALAPPAEVVKEGQKAKPKAKAEPEPVTAVEEPTPVKVDPEAEKPVVKVEPKKAEAAPVNREEIRTFVRTGYTDLAKKEARKTAFKGLLAKYEVENIDAVPNDQVAAFFEELKAAFA